MKTFHKACQIIFQIAIINFLLFVFIAIMIGGDAVNGHAENGHYYLANHGQLTEVNYFVFMYSKLHAYSIFITHPLAMLAGFLYWITGGGSVRPKSLAAYPHSKSSLLSIIKSFLWKVADLIEGVFWIILDSWRKPDYELFVRLSKEECIRELQAGTDNEPTLYKLNKPLWGYFSGNHFYLQKWNYNPYFRDGGVRPVLAGKFSSTPQGTYIRLWHRFTTIGIFFLTTWFGTALSLLSLYLISTNIHSSQQYAYLDSRLPMLALIIAPILYISTFFISIQIGSIFGKSSNFDIIEFVKDLLDHHHTSSQLAGFRLSRKMQGKV